MFLVSSYSCLCPINWSQVLSWEWRCKWSSTDRWCSNYIWVINKFIAHWGAACIRGLTVVVVLSHNHWFWGIAGGLNIGSSNGLMSGGTKSLSEPMSTYHQQQGPVTMIWEQLHKRHLSHQLLISAWKLLIIEKCKYIFGFHQSISVRQS